MRRNKGEKVNLFVAAFIIFIVIGGSLFLGNKIVFRSNFLKYVKKTSDQTMVLKKEIKVTYFKKNYVIILSTPEGKNEELYANCFEEKIGGLYYVPSYSASQGKCKSLYGAICNFMNNGTDDKFIVVYGYNKDYMASSYSVESTLNQKPQAKDISKEEYFLDTYEDIVYGKVFFQDKNDKDITPLFIRQ